MSLARWSLGSFFRTCSLHWLPARYATLALCAILGFLLLIPGIARSAPALGPGSASLAIRQEADDTWQVADEGWVPAGVTRVRSSAFGARVVRLGESTLTIGANTQLRLDADKKRVELAAGNVYLETAAAAEWSIETGSQRILVSPASRVEVTAATSRLRVGVESGRATLHPDIDDALTLDAARSARLDVESAQWKARDWPANERQQDLAWLRQADTGQGLGQLLIQDAQQGSPERLHVARYHVNVVLKPPVALVQIDQSFYNPYSAQAQGTFLFNLPSGASVSRFAMYVTPTRLIEGELIERRRAREIYDRIVSRRRDPAILEQIGDNLFRMQVFPVFARDTKRILLDYTVPLESTDNSYRFQLPLLSDREPVWDFRLQGSAELAGGISDARSASHPELEIRRDDGKPVTVRFEFARRMYDPQSDFVFSFRRVEEKETRAEVRAFRAEPLPGKKDDTPDSADRPAGTGENSNEKSDEKSPPDPWSDRPVTYFLATLPSGAARAADPADVLILTDTSSDSLSHRQAIRRALQCVANNLRARDRFRLGAIDVDSRLLTDQWVTPGTEAAREAIASWEQQFFLGATDLETSFRSALSAWQQEGERRRVLVYVGDGADSVEQAAIEQLPRRLATLLQSAGIEFAAVNVGDHPEGQAVLRRCAEQTVGIVFDGTRGSGLEDLFRWALCGVPRPLEVDCPATSHVEAQELFYERRVLPWQAVRLAGRTLHPESAAITVSVRDGVAENRYDIAIGEAATGDDVFLGRLWARRKLQQLVREDERLGAEQDTTQHDSVRQRIVRLSREWSLLSPFTAFLVLETEADYERWNIRRQQRRRYWRPAERLPDEPLPAEWLERVRPTGKAGDRAGKQPTETPGEEQIQKTLDAARKAIEEQRFHASLELLDDLSPVPPGTAEQVRVLKQMAFQAIERQQREQRTLEDLPLFRWDESFQPTAVSFLPVLAAWAANDARTSRFGPALARQVELPDRKWQLEQLATWLESRSGIPVDLDRRSLDDYGLSSKLELRSIGQARLSLASGVELLLEQADLYLLEEEDRLLITTKEVMERRQATRVTQIGDLLRPGEVAPLELLLADPRDQVRSQAEQRLRQRLEQPVTFEFVDTPLEKALESLRRQWDVALMIDRRALDDVGLGTDVPVTVRARRLPAAKALERLLEPFDLDFRIEREAIRVTTPDENESRLKVRLHSGRGVLAAWPFEPSPEEAAAQRVGNLNPFAPVNAPAWGPGALSTSGWDWGEGRFGRPFLGGGFAGGAGFGGGGGMGGTFGGGLGGGGLGGGGFGGGGFGGAMGGTLGGAAGGGPTGAAFGGPAPVADAGGLSQGGTGEERVLETTQDESPPDVDAEEAAETREVEATASSQRTGAAALPGGMEYQVDVEGLRETITSTVEPSMWDEVGGPASISFFAPTLDLVVAGTDRLHAEIDALLDQMRSRGIEPGTGAKPATVQDAVRGELTIQDLDAVIELLTSTVRSETWEDVGGPNSVSADPARLALTVRADPVTHREIDRLFTLLRRSRYETVFNSQPWQSGTAQVLDRGLAQLDPRLSLSELPEPSPEELELLSARRRPESFGQVWRRVGGEGGESTTIELRQGPDWLEAVTPLQRLRCMDDRVAVAHPDVTLAEIGPWSEAARRRLDHWLPWMPHRDNRELARMFHVLADEPAEGAEQAAAQRRLRLVPAGLAAGGNTFLRMSLDARTGAVESLEAVVEGTSVAFLTRQVAEEGTDDWERYELRDAEGRVLGRWELTAFERSPEKPAELLSGWERFAVLHVDRSLTTGGDLRTVLAAMRDHKWEAAAEGLNRRLRQNPGQPLLLFLRSWCLSRDAAQRDVIWDVLLSDLRQVASSRATALTRAIEPAHFPQLTPPLLYDLLQRQPTDSRSPADLARLARLALQLGQLSQAVEHARESLRGDPPPAERFERVRMLAESLSRSGRVREAEDAVTGWVWTEPDVAHVASIASLLGRLGRKDFAERMLTDQQTERHLSAEQRRVLVRAQADLRDGMARWKLLLQAASLAPTAPVTRHDLAALLEELRLPAHADAAAQLAQTTPVPEHRDALRLKQARLTTDGKQAGELIWSVWQAGRLPESQLHWAAQQLIAAGMPSRAVQLLESPLRADRPLDDGLRALLAVAYEMANRPVDARRARTQDPPPPAMAPTVPTPGGFF